MKPCSIKVNVKISWWLKVYLYGVGFTSNLTGLEPSMDRVNWWIARGIKVELTATQQ